LVFRSYYIHSFKWKTSFWVWWRICAFWHDKKWKNWVSCFAMEVYILFRKRFCIETFIEKS